VRENADVFVVEDDGGIRSVVEIALESAGVGTVRTFADGGEAWDGMCSSPPRIVLLDLMLPSLGGLEICRRMRGNARLAKVPVIMMTALGSEEDVVAGLEAGADDYVTKPFSPAVLVARVRAQLRRAEGGGNGTLSLGGLEVDIPSRRVVLEGSPLGPFTAYEFAALELFMRNPSRVFTRSALIDAVQGTEKAVTDRGVDVVIVGLRRKLGRWAKHLETGRGMGYGVV
jgi:two-component system phosphate regulon response regulator PhoB